MSTHIREVTRRQFIQLTSTGLAAVALGRTSVDRRIEEEPDLSPAALTERFAHPPAESRPWCYWYWMNGNITREGIRADLEGLAGVGIGGVLLFDIALLPAGPVVNRTPEWYDLVKFAVSEAGKRNIKVIVNCPGWSGTGGPWITPELSMQELTWSETVALGPGEFSGVLPKPPTRLGYYRDAAVLAFPTPAGDEPLPVPQVTDGDGKPLAQAASALQPQPILSAAQISQTPAVSRADAASEPENGRPKPAPADLPLRFNVIFPAAVEIRSVYLRAARQSGDFRAELSAWDDAKGAFQLVSRFESHGAGPFSAHIGSASFPTASAAKFQLAFVNRKAGTRILVEALRFSSGFRLPDWTIKAGFATQPPPPATSEFPPETGDRIPFDQVLDLTDKLSPDGRLDWVAPTGRWTILRLGCTPTGMYLFPTPLGGAGLDCDKLSQEAADFHYDHCVKPLLRELGPELSGRALAGYHSDSYESGWQNWSAKFPREFHQRRGYDLTKYLPALTGRVVGSLETTERFLWDFRRTIGDLFADNNYGRLAQKCHEDGLLFSSEPYGGPFEQLQVGLRADHPMTEVWLPGAAQGPEKIGYQAVFSGRAAGRKIVGAESFTSQPPAGGKWRSHPFSLKPLGDFIYCCGVNQLCLHVNAHHPLIGDHLRPGFTCGLNGMHFDRGNTWWDHGAREWVSYLTRCQALLQTGEAVADVLCFQGNDSPAAVGSCNPTLPAGYDFDACNSEILDGVSVKEGRLMLRSGKTYRYLVLPAHGRVTLPSLRKIAALAQSGAQIVGTVPHESPSLADAAAGDEYEQLIRQLKTSVRMEDSFQKILATDKLSADFIYKKDAGLVLHYVHRRDGEDDFYFVASASPQAGSVECTFRVTGKIPELWHPDTGVMEPCPVYEQDGETTRIPLHFDSAGSVFVVFRAGVPAPRAISVADVSDTSVRALKDFPCSLSSDGRQLTLRAWRTGRYTVTMPSHERKVVTVDSLPPPQAVDGPWTVHFPTGWGAPDRITLDKLISWSDFPDPGVRFFSGTATYKTTFASPQLDRQNRLFLDLGRVEVIAEVWLNEESLGLLWKPPFLCDVTRRLRSKRNTLEVRVTNLWPNRLIGDEQFPDDCTVDGQWKSGVIPSWPDWLKQGHPRPEPRRLTFCTWKQWGAHDALLPSGLLGPVLLRQARIADATGT